MARQVLIVDDSTLMRQLIAGVLVGAGWDVAGEATSGEDAVRCYKELRPDLVTLDIVMPGLGGIVALRKIMAFDPAAKVVVITALNKSKLVSEAARAGAREFLAKPFLPEQLREICQRTVPEMVGS